MDAPPALYYWHEAVHEPTGALTALDRGLKRSERPSAVYADAPDGPYSPAFLPFTTDIAGSVLAPYATRSIAVSVGEIEAGRGIPSNTAVSWGALSSDAQARLLAVDPLTVGNLAGVPVEVRVDANVLNAKNALIAGTVDAVQARYLEQVVLGERRLLTFDLENDRIVEIIGEISPRTDRVVVYVPGSDADFAAFAKGEIQGIADYLVTGDRRGSTVALVVKDGPWANWNQLGGRSNYDPQFADATGTKIADIINSLERDPHLASASRIAIGHSWGMSALSNAETKGARFDEVYSLAGGWLDAEWSARPGTKYTHVQYGTDAINYFEPTGDFPHERPEFDQRQLEPEGMSIMGRLIQNEPFNHGRVSVGVELNEPALDAIFESMHGGRSVVATGGGDGR